jgi:Protein of unknown function (DUF551)
MTPDHLARHTEAVARAIATADANPEIGKNLLINCEPYMAKCRDLATAAIAAMLPVWQPIETAPKDGSDILIYAHGMCIEARYSPGQWSIETPISCAEYDGPVWVAFDDAVQFEIEETPHGDFHGRVTHWMPLPTPPENNNDH